MSHFVPLCTIRAQLVVANRDAKDRGDAEDAMFRSLAASFGSQCICIMLGDCEPREDCPGLKAVSDAGVPVL